MGVYGVAHADFSKNHTQWDVQHSILFDEFGYDDFWGLNLS